MQNDEHRANLRQNKLVHWPLRPLAILQRFMASSFDELVTYRPNANASDRRRSLFSRMIRFTLVN